MKISALASGSSGNCFYINHHDDGILVDAGISCRQVVERLCNLHQNPEKIKGIFVTHEHSDHVKGVDVLARRFNIPIFASRGTIKNSFLCSDKRLINEIKEKEVIKLGGMEVQGFSKCHNAAQPFSYKIKNDKVISIITDIGHACKNVVENVNDSDMLIIESNHDLNMLEDGPYPYFLKRLIGSEIGHLSNLHSSLCVLEHANSRLKHVMLSHLSEVNNTPELAFNTFSSLIKERIDLKPKISLSLRKPTSLFNV